MEGEYGERIVRSLRHYIDGDWFFTKNRGGAIGRPAGGDNDLINHITRSHTIGSPFGIPITWQGEREEATIQGDSGQSWLFLGTRYDRAEFLEFNRQILSKIAKKQLYTAPQIEGNYYKFKFSFSDKELPKDVGDIRPFMLSGGRKINNIILTFVNTGEPDGFVLDSIDPVFDKPLHQFNLQEIKTWIKSYK